MLFRLCMDISRVLLLVMAVEIKFMESDRASLAMYNSNCNLKGLRFLKGEIVIWGPYPSTKYS